MAKINASALRFMNHMDAYYLLSQIIFTCLIWYDNIVWTKCNINYMAFILKNNTYLNGYWIDADNNLKNMYILIAAHFLQPSNLRNFARFAIFARYCLGFPRFFNTKNVFS